MTNESEEKRQFSYMHIKALMFLCAAHGAIMSAEATEMKFDSQEELDAYPAKRRRELEDKLSSLLDETWEKAK
jgi:hypothetical protein